MKKLIFSFIFFLILASFTFFSYSKPYHRVTHKDIQVFVNSLTPSESFALDFFFRSLIQEEQAGYVFLGEKPMSLHSYLIPKSSPRPFSVNPVVALDLFFSGFAPDSNLFHDGFNIWKKYQHRFCGKNIYFDLIENDEDLHFAKVVVLNRNVLEAVFREHNGQFSKVSHLMTKNKSLFDALLQDSRFKDKFYSEHCLLGIALGFGNRNAELFAKMDALANTLGLLKFTPIKLTQNRTDELKREYLDISKSLKGLHDNDSKKFLFTLGVGFRADFSDPETLSLQKKYKQARKSLTQLYCNKGFLEKTLELIVEAERSS